jgi:stage IV sporulation protein B
MTERSDKLNIKKRVGAFFVLLLISATALFVECDVYFPEEIHVYDGQQVEMPKGFAYTLEASNTVQTYGDYDATVKLFGVIPVKEVTVNIEPEKSLTPGGKAVGIKMFTKGLICVGTQEVEDADGRKVNSAKTLDIKNGDIITAADGVELHTVEQFADIVEKSGGRELSLIVLRN